MVLISLRCMHLHGGTAQAGNPCHWAGLLKHALRSLARLLFLALFQGTQLSQAV